MKKVKDSGVVIIRIPRTYKKAVLLQYDNCGPSVQVVTSIRPLTLKRIAKHFENVDGANWEVDSLTILSNNGEIPEFSIDKSLVL